MANVLMDFSPSYSISPWVCVSGNNSFYHLLIEKKKNVTCALRPIIIIIVGDRLDIFKWPKGTMFLNKIRMKKMQLRIQGTGQCPSQIEEWIFVSICRVIFNFYLFISGNYHFYQVMASRLLSLMLRLIEKVWQIHRFIMSFFSSTKNYMTLILIKQQSIK